MWSSEKREVPKVTSPIGTLTFFVNVACKNSRRLEGTILILLCINSNDISVHWKYKHWNWRQKLRS